MSFLDTFAPIMGAGCASALCWLLYALCRYILLPLLVRATKAK